MKHHKILYSKEASRDLDGIWEYIAKAGRVSAEEFYAWSVQAREKKKDCDQGNISLEEYQDWLKHS